MLIKTLTPQQEELIPVYRDKWINKLYTLPKINKEACRKGVEWLYSFCNLNKPMVIFLSSPLSLRYCADLLQNNKKFQELKKKAEKNNVAIEDCIVEETFNNMNNPKISVKTSNDFCSYGDISDYVWCAWVDYFVGIEVIEGNEDYHNLVKLLDSGVFTMIQLDGACLISSMPTNMILNDSGELHSEVGACIEWDDGYKLFALDGIVIPQDFYTKVIKKSMSPKELMGLDNKELQMIAIKYYGIENMLNEVNSRLINTGVHKYKYSIDPTIREQTYKLYEIKDLFSDTEYCLIYDCPSTGRVYCSFMSTVVKEHKNHPELALLCAAKKRGISLHELKNNIFTES